MATSATAQPPPPTDLAGALDSVGVKASAVEGISLNSFFASLSVAAVVFAVQFIMFVVIKNRLPRVYQPRTYLVPGKERTEAPPHGLMSWLIPVFSTTKSDFIEKCGLDAYFFLRFLRTLLKIFIVLALVILPILLPLNMVGGRGADFSKRGGPQYNNVTGLDQLAFGNIRPDRTHRYWAHLILAIFVVIVVCYVFFDELRYYVRLRQRYLTTPQHRLRASATTVLVTGIPRKYCNAKALEELFDVFPGGIRNIWINRNYDHLSEKIIWRNKVALRLEDAETRLIQKVKKAYMKKVAKQAKQTGQKPTRKEKTEQQLQDDIDGTLTAYQADGVAAGDPHQVKHTVWEATHDETGQSLARPRRPWLPVPALEQGLGFVGHRFNQLGRTVRRGLPGWMPGQPHPAAVDGPSDDPAEHTVPEAATAGVAGVQPLADASQTHETTDSSLATAAAAPAGNTTVSATGAPPGPRPELTASTTLDVDDAGLTSVERRKTDDGEVQPKRAKRVKFWRRDRSTVDLETGPKSEKPGAPTGCTCVTDERYTMPYDSRYEEDDDDDENDGEPLWKKYVSQKDRETMRVPPFGEPWMPSIPFVGKRVDTIFYCRKLLARLNLEVEHDQRHPDTYPLMNSAFVQFNSQMAAHMAAQSLTHHMPRQMAPRMVEISPDDVIWENMAAGWMERYVRTTLIWLMVASLVVGWAFPVTFTGLLSQIKSLTLLVPWLAWINNLPSWVVALVQGVLPQILLALLMALLPVILRALARKQGCCTGNAIELTVQNYYFVFLFVQVFLIVSISSGITTAMRQLVRSVGSAPAILAINLPRASNYFFSYMLLQAFSVSAGALLQLGSLANWFILAPLTDLTARQRWARQTNLPTMQWGSFFPVYTNLAAIGLIYSVISPLILVFNIITFAMFWVAYRYNTLYVTKFRFDTGGLLYPRAINQLFTGLYVMELCLIGLFFLVRDDQDEIACRSQAIIMIIVTILTAIYQYLLNDAFGPLFQFLPVTLEDDAVVRDKRFAAEQEQRRLVSASKEKDPDAADQSLSVEERERREDERRAQAIALMTEKELEMKLQHSKNYRLKRSDLKRGESVDPKQDPATATKPNHTFPLPGQVATSTLAALKHRLDQETQREINSGQALFFGLHDQLEDLTPEERDLLVQRAFQHEALRAKRPVVWIPRDRLGVSDDEVYRTQRFTKHIWISNQYTGLDSKCRVVFRRSPPDFSELDLIEL